MYDYIVIVKPKLVSLCCYMRTMYSMLIRSWPKAVLGHDVQRLVLRVVLPPRVILPPGRVDGGPSAVRGATHSAEVS